MNMRKMFPLFAFIFSASLVGQVSGMETNTPNPNNENIDNPDDYTIVPNDAVNKLFPDNFKILSQEEEEKLSEEKLSEEKTIYKENKESFFKLCTATGVNKELTTELNEIVKRSKLGKTFTEFSERYKQTKKVVYQEAEILENENKLSTKLIKLIIFLWNIIIWVSALLAIPLSLHCIMQIVCALLDAIGLLKSSLFLKTLQVLRIKDSDTAQKKINAIFNGLQKFNLLANKSTHQLFLAEASFAIGGWIAIVLLITKRLIPKEEA